MAIDDLLDEHEQSRRVQEWLRRNGGGLIGGVLLGLAAVGGWKWWQQREAQAHMREADAYQAVVQAVDADGAKAAARVQSLPAGVYRSVAAMHVAKAQVDAGKPAEAIRTLQSSMPADAALRGVFEHRIARLMIDGGKAADAIALLKGDDAQSLELRGDAQFALGQVDQARESYRKALTKVEVGSPARRLVELKYTQVGGTPDPSKTP